MKRIATAFRLLPLGLLSLLGLNSCAMVAVEGVNRETYSSFRMQRGPKGETLGSQQIEPTTKGRNPTRKELVAAWGEPSRKRTNAGSEPGETWVWDNKSQEIWGGVLIVAGIVPVPLMLPVDHEGMEIRFGAGEGPALDWTDKRHGESFAGIGISPDEGGSLPQLGPFFWGKEPKRQVLRD